MENIVGPLLTDKELFDALDYSLPETQPILEALNKGDSTAARHAFAECVRASIKPEIYFSIPGKVIKPELTDTLKRDAERALRHEMVSCGTPMKFEGKVDWYANPTYNQYREWPWQLSRHPELVYLANAYRATGEERYAEGCAELFDSWVKQAVCPGYDAPQTASVCWRTIECGIRMGLTWPDIIHSCVNSAAFNDDILIDWCKSVYEHSERVLARFTVGNWLIHELNGLAQSGLIYPFFKDSKSWIETAFRKLSEELEKQIYPDGFQFELTTGYQGVVVRHYMAVMEVATAYNYPVPKNFYDMIEKMLNVYVVLRLSSNRVPNINDGGHASPKSQLAPYARYFPENELFRWIMTDGKEGKKPDFNSVLLPYAGMVLFREGWSTDDVSAFFDAGPFGEAHQHEDKLNLIICANGRNLLAEANTYAYDTSDMRKYVVSTRGHNTVRVNGMDQNRLKGYKWQHELLSVKADVTFDVTDELEVARGYYDEGYGPEKQDLARHERGVIFVKKPKVGRPFFIVVDRLTSETENAYESIWHFDVPEITLTANGIKSADITAFMCGDVGAMSIVRGSEYPEVQGFTCHSSLQGSAKPIPTLLHTVKGKDVLTVTVFSVHDENGSPIKNVSLDKDTVTVTYLNGETDAYTLA